MKVFCIQFHKNSLTTPLKPNHNHRNCPNKMRKKEKNLLVQATVEFKINMGIYFCYNLCFFTKKVISELTEVLIAINAYWPKCLYNL